MNYEKDGVRFTNIDNAGLFTGGPKISKAKYREENGTIKEPMKIINAIDIDWNNAQITGISNPINSTSELLSLIGNIKQSIDKNLDRAITWALTNVHWVSGPNSMKQEETITITFAANTGYNMPDNVNVNGATYSYNKNNGTITLSNPTANEIAITINSQSKKSCTFTVPSLSNLSCTLSGNQSTFTINDTFNIQLNVTGDSDLYALPTSITGTGCSILSYNSSTGTAILKCLGTGNMTISATAKDNATYYFAVALETNSIFTKVNGTITGCKINNITNVPGVMTAIGSCPINFDNGFTPHSSVDVEGTDVWFIIPSKFFNKNNYNFINGNNKYLLKQSNIQDLTYNTKLKDCVDIPASGNNKVAYTLVCVSNNGLVGPQEFKKI